MFQIKVSSEADKVLKKWKKSNPQLWKKYQKIYDELMDHPRTGLGHPKPLRGGGSTFSVTAINAKAQEASVTPDGRLSAKDITVKLIPYYAWNHRGAGRMDVWLARSLSGLED